jgi:hypothetical protein
MITTSAKFEASCLENNIIIEEGKEISTAFHTGDQFTIGDEEILKASTTFHLSFKRREKAMILAQ